MIGAIAQGAGALISGISGLFTAGAQRRAARKYYKERTANAYTASPYAAQSLAMANNMHNGRMAGAANAEGNIFRNQANMAAAAQRGATSGSQYLATLGAAQGMGDEAINNLAVAEAQNKAQTAGMVMQANQGMTDELSKVHQDRIAALDGKAAMTGAAIQNTQTAFNQIGSGLMAAGGAIGGAKAPMKAPNYYG